LVGGVARRLYVWTGWLWLFTVRLCRWALSLAAACRWWSCAGCREMGLLGLQAMEIPRRQKESV